MRLFWKKAASASERVLGVRPEGVGVPKVPSDGGSSVDIPLMMRLPGKSVNATIETRRTVGRGACTLYCESCFGVDDGTAKCHAIQCVQFPVYNRQHLLKGSAVLSAVLPLIAALFVDTYLIDRPRIQLRLEFSLVQKPTACYHDGFYPHYSLRVMMALLGSDVSRVQLAGLQFTFGI